ncbi:MAG: low temperature requirement protein A [Ardenticatenaceae bacterium]
MSDSRWQPPRLHTELKGHEERKVTWLELFYDLVYVATIIQLGNTLSDDVSPLGFIKFVTLFVLIWWSWTGITFYINRFVVDDVWHRVLIFIQILPITIVGVSVEGAFGELASQFALAYVGIRGVLVLLYLRAWKHVETARPLISRYMAGFSLAAFIWLISAFVPTPWNYMLWGLGMFVDFGTPLLPRTRALQSLLRPDVEHMSERYGLLTIIVLGEGFVKTIGSASGQHITLSAFIFSIFGLSLAYSLWWIYFDDVAGAEVNLVGRAPYVWIYSHLPVTIALTAFGVAIKKLYLLPPVELLPDKYRWLFCVAVMLYLIFVALIDLVTVREDQTLDSKTRARFRFASAAFVLLLAILGTQLTPLLFMILMVVGCVGPIIIELNMARKNVAISPKPFTAEVGSRE